MLDGRVKFELFISDDDIRSISAGISKMAYAGAADLAKAMAERGVEFLRRLETSVGHTSLANKWTHRQVPAPNGGAVEEIYNQAETEWFKHATKRATYIILGVDLLKILEAGAKKHEIVPVLAKALSFRASVGSHQSMYRGTLFKKEGEGVHRRGGIGGFIFRRPVDDYISVPRVKHPGVKGNEFVAKTRNYLYEVADSELPDRASRMVIWRPSPLLY